MNPSKSYNTPNPLSLENATESALDGIPDRALAELLDSSGDAADPAKRDYGERYSFLRVIGEGGQGVVVCAQDNLLGREVAIKALKDLFDPAREAYLEREAKLCGMLEHPNILPTYDLRQDETGSPFFVMKKIAGVSLEEMLKDSHQEAKTSRRGRGVREYSRLRLLNIFLQVCRAIEYAHSRGVLHMDLKPENVKLGQFGEVYVLDWGFAARVDEEQKVLGGTPIYIAPERLRGENPDARSDIYSLGVMLYRLLTNQHPRNVSQMTFREYRERFEQIPLVPLRQRDHSLPPDLEAIVMKALADDPAGRYQAVHDLAEDLQRFLDLLPVRAYAEGPLGRTWKFIRRHKRMAAAVTAVVLFLAAAGAVTWWNYKLEKALQVEREAVRRRAQARIPLDQGRELLEKLRETVENARGKREKLALLEPVLALFSRAVARNPDDADVFYERGKAFYLARDMESAKADFQRAYEKDKSFIMAHYYAGRIWADVYHHHAKAREEFEAMKAVDRDNQYSELGQARIDLAEQRFDEALERCRRIEQLNSALTDVWYIRGMVYGSRKQSRHYDSGKALEAYNRFLATRRDNPSAFANRGDLRKDRGDYDGAITDYKAALNVNPRYHWALNNLGYVLYFYKKDPRQGLTYIEKALEIDPKNFWAYLNRAAIYESLKKWEAAEEDYRYADELCLSYPPLKKNAPLIAYRQGIFLFRRGRLDKAAKLLTRAIDLSAAKERGIRLHRRGIVHLARRRYADAVRDFTDSIRLRTEGVIYPALMRWLAQRLSGRPAEPRELAKNLNPPADKPWLAAVGSLYLGEAKAEEAMRLATTPEAKCEVSFYLGAHALATGKPEAARRRLRRAVNTGVHLYMEYSLAQIFLQSISAPEKPIVKEERKHRREAKP